MGIIPTVLFCLKHIETRKEAIFVLQKTGIPFLLVAFQLVLFGTLIQTGTGFIHAVNERIHSALRERGSEFPNWQRPLIAAILLLMGLGISSFGLINLIAKGYGSISWGIFIFYFVPLVTFGLYQIIKRS